MVDVLPDSIVTRDVLVDFKELHLTGHGHGENGYALKDTGEVPELNIGRPLIVIVECVEGLDDSLKGEANVEGNRCLAHKRQRFDALLKGQWNNEDDCGDEDHP